MKDNRISGYIGTYTKHFGRGRADGIYAFAMNPENGAIENLRLAAEINDP